MPIWHLKLGWQPGPALRLHGTGRGYAFQRLAQPAGVQVNIAIMRAFVRLREMFLTNAELARKLADLEQKYDSQFKAVFDAIRQLMAPSPAPPKSEIGFHVKEDAVPYRTSRRRPAPNGS